MEYNFDGETWLVKDSYCRPQLVWDRGHSCYCMEYNFYLLPLFYKVLIPKFQFFQLQNGTKKFVKECFLCQCDKSVEIEYNINVFSSFGNFVVDIYFNPTSILLYMMI